MYISIFIVYVFDNEVFGDIKYATVTYPIQSCAALSTFALVS